MYYFIKCKYRNITITSPEEYENVAESNTIIRIEKVYTKWKNERVEVKTENVPLHQFDKMCSGIVTLYNDICYYKKGVLHNEPDLYARKTLHDGKLHFHYNGKRVFYNLHKNRRKMMSVISEIK